MNQAEDVEIVLGHERRYKFHSGTLARNSTFFAELLTEQSAVKLSHKARAAGVKVRWMVELVEMPGEEWPAGRLGLVELTPTATPLHPHTPLIPNPNGQPSTTGDPTTVFDYWETVLYSFYNTSRINDSISSSSPMHDLLVDCNFVLEIGEYLGCVALIGKPIEVALLKRGQELWGAVAKRPAHWIVLAYRVRSEVVWREAFVHLVGCWKGVVKESGNAVAAAAASCGAGEHGHNHNHSHGSSNSNSNGNNADGNPPAGGTTNAMAAIRTVPGLKALIEKYHEDLMRRCRNLEVVLISMYPGGLSEPSEDVPIKREVFARDILVWMALGWFRHWLGQKLVMEKGHHAEDSGFDLYTALAAAGSAYMEKKVINQFHAKFPMTKKAINVCENHLLEIKECVKQKVLSHGILASTLHLDLKLHPVKYMTCTQFNERDLPWFKEHNPATGESAGCGDCGGAGVHAASWGGEKRKWRAGGNQIAIRTLEETRKMKERELEELGHELEQLEGEDDMGMLDGDDDDEVDEPEEEDELPARAAKRVRF